MRLPKVCMARAAPPRRPCGGCEQRNGRRRLRPLKTGEGAVGVPSVLVGTPDDQAENEHSDDQHEIQDRGQTTHSAHISGRRLRRSPVTRQSRQSRVAHLARTGGVNSPPGSSRASAPVNTFYAGPTISTDPREAFMNRQHQTVRSNTHVRTGLGGAAVILLVSAGTAYAANEWTGANIVDGSLTSEDIANNNLQGADIANATIISADLQNETNINDDMRQQRAAPPTSTTSRSGSGDVANGSLASADILDGTLTGVDIADGSVDGADISNGSLTSADILNGTLTGADVEERA